MGYWIPVEGGIRIYEGSLRDAYLDCAKTLLSAYYRTNGNIHRLIPEYSSTNGIPIYDSRTGKKYSHYVRFYNGSNPRDGYEECAYNPDTGVSYRAKNFPRNWIY